MRKVAQRKSYGAPLSRIIRDLDLDISRTALNKLDEWYMYAKYDLNLLRETEEEAELYERVMQSLFPAWLDENGTDVQSSPEDWTYVGYFPRGQWVKNDN